MDNQEIQDAEDDRRIDGDRLVKVPRWVLEDVLGIVGLSEAASIPRKIATQIATEIQKRISQDDHPAGGG